MLGILVAASLPLACEVTDVEDEELLEEEGLDEEVRSQGHHVIKLEAEADTYVRTDRNIRRNDNYGCQDFMEVGTGRRGGNLRPEGAPDAMRSLVRFDLPDIEVDAVSSATLELSLSHFDHGSDDSVYRVDAHRVLSPPWSEGNGFETSATSGEVPAGCTDPDQAFGVAWRGGRDPLNLRQSRRYGRNNQTQPSFDPTVVGSVTIPQDAYAPGDVVAIDVTELVKDWLAGAPNEGLLLRDVTTDGSFRGVAFGTHEGEEAGGVAGPRLVITTLPVFPEVEITAVDSMVELRWTPRRYSTYSIFRSTDPTFTYTDPGATLIASGLTGGIYTDELALDLFDLLHPAEPYDIGAFYQIVEDGPRGRISSAVVGRIPIPVRLSDPRLHPLLSHSKVPLCLDATPPDAHQRMLIQEDPLTIHWWNPAEQRFHADAAPFDAVLELEVGQFFSVATRPDPRPGIVYYQLSGRVPAACEMSSDVYEGFNAVVWPATAEPIRATELLSMLPGATAVARWPVLGVGYGVEWYPARPPKDLPGVGNHLARYDFQIEPCTALYVYADRSDEPDGTPLDLVWPMGSAECEG